MKILGGKANSCEFCNGTVFKLLGKLGVIYQCRNCGYAYGRLK